MSPRSLLFSSSQETSRPLIQALEELELAVEYCPEIFAAIKELTSRGFEVIVADLDDGPEAEFLLKTARELKVSQNAFVLAVAGKTSKAPARHSHADLVLAKPLIPDQVKYALLTCDRFLACFRAWIGKSDSATGTKARSQLDNPPQTAEHSSANAGLVARPAVRSPMARQALGRVAVTARLASTPIDPGNLRSHYRPTTRPALWDSIPQRTKRTYRRLLWATLLGVVLLPCVYTFPHLFQNKRLLTRAATAVWRVSERTYELATKLRTPQSPEPETIESSDLEVVIRAAGSRTHRSAGPSAGRAIPLVHSSVPDQVLSVGSENRQAEVQPLADHVSVAAAFIPIPESIRLAQPQADTLPNLFGRPSPSLLGELEPVLLSEDTAERLLLEKVEPSYPLQALKTGLQGSVVLQAWIARDGSMQDLKLVSGSLLLGQAAYDAVKHWRYKPYLRNGKAVTAQTYVTVNFRLPQQSLLAPLPH